MSGRQISMGISDLYSICLSSEASRAYSRGFLCQFSGSNSITLDQLDLIISGVVFQEKLSEIDGDQKETGRWGEERAFLPRNVTGLDLSGA